MTDLAARAALPDRSVVPAVWSRITNLVVERGEGSWLITTDGTRYLDYSSGIGVVNTGHAHPRVVAAIQEQAAKLLHGQQNIVYHEAGLRLHERLARLLDRKSTRLNSSHLVISYAVFCLKKKRIDI